MYGSPVTKSGGLAGERREGGGVTSECGGLGGVFTVNDVTGAMNGASAQRLHMIIILYK